MSGVVTVGETMALLSVPADGLLRGPVPVGIGGAESNVAIALSRLGVPVTWISRLGDDGLGTYVRREIRAEGVTVLAARDPEAPTGIMVKEHRGGRPTRVRYYRTGSAASRMTPGDVDPGVVAGADVLHLTGITPALGPGPLAAVEHAAAVARRAGTLVSLDVNHRRTLWSDERASRVLAGLIAGADLVFAGHGEAAMVLGVPDPGPVDWAAGEALAARLAALGPATVVVKLGALGAVAHHHDRTVRAPTTAITVVDAVGAGDAFAGGYLADHCRGGELSRCLDTANRVAGAVVTVRGDWEGLPTAADLAAADLAASGPAASGPDAEVIR